MAGAAAARIMAGPHTLGARVCSVRGACGALTVSLDVRPWEQTLEPAAEALLNAHADHLTRHLTRR